MLGTGSCRPREGDGEVDQRGELNQGWDAALEVLQDEGLEGGEFADFGRDAAVHAVRTGDVQLGDPAGSTLDAFPAGAAVGRVGVPRREVGGIAEGLFDEE